MTILQLVFNVIAVGSFLRAKLEFLPQLNPIPAKWVHLGDQREKSMLNFVLSNVAYIFEVTSFRENIPHNLLHHRSILIQQLLRMDGA